MAIPQDFICSITLLPMKDPVIAQDGHTYEREAIVHWLQTNPNSPLTRQPMRIDALKPNTKLKQAIEKYNKKDEKKVVKNHIPIGLPSIEADQYYALSIYQQDLQQVTEHSYLQQEEQRQQQSVVYVQQANRNQQTTLTPEQRKKYQVFCLFILAFVIFIILVSKII